jgi:hypothetical protein
MKRLLILVSLSLLRTYTSHGQTNHELIKDTLKHGYKILYILKTNYTIITLSFPNVDANSIDSINSYTKSKAIKIFGPKAKNGAVTIKFKKGTELLNINQLFDLYKLQNKKRSLSVFIDSTICFHPEAMYFEAKIVKSVKIQSEKNNGMKYISIRTIYPIHRHSNTEIIFRGIANKNKSLNQLKY